MTQFAGQVSELGKGCGGVLPVNAAFVRSKVKVRSYVAQKKKVVQKLGGKQVRVKAQQNQEESMTAFAISPPGENEVEKDDFLQCPTLRHKLKPRPSPFVIHNNFGGGFVNDRDRVALQSMKFASVDSSGAGCFGGTSSNQDGDGNSAYPAIFEASMEQLCIPLPPWAVRAGARETIYFNPAETTVAIVTCGGLCPGLNDVVQGIVKKLSDYGVPDGNIWGIRYGFQGFYNQTDKPIVLNRENVDGIHLEGGTILGTSRGGADIKQIVKKLDMWGVDMVFVIGGNGGNAGAAAIQQKCEEFQVDCAVVGVPKSIDNDILLIDKCFGFDTAVDEAQRALLAAKVEAMSALRGIGLVKLMGRQSGFISLQASLASGVVDVCLIPEVPFQLDGPFGLKQYVGKLLRDKGHCVICIAEGAGQEMISGQSQGQDASGNPILKDVGLFVKSELKKEFSDADIKYIDPTYMIRAIPTGSQDRVYCKILAHNAVHAAFAGYTGITVGLVNTHYVYLPIPIVIQAPRKVDPRGKMWNRLRASIGQPNFYDENKLLQNGRDIWEA
eukprot:TRINITY_DN3172_c0_g1_i2.p1 TRINITY_DN3172_c0_g1~~TRINITY_DN3172_c0_g1_i2.p1  ORF type:complete len:555 (-),score=96.10 TRINITY_DN3172_c0_g1_i2:219-1883(-)